MFSHFVPLVGVGEVGADPGTGNVVGQEVFGDVGPADRVVLGNPRPGDAIQLACLQCHFDVFPGQRHGNHAEAGEELAGGGEGEDAFALQVGQAADWLDGGEVARIPGAAAKPGDALYFAVGLGPDLVETVVVEQRRYVQAVASGE